jgi:AraC-like DNA-binding protein
METVAHYSQKNILVIPQSLYFMSDIKLLIQLGNSGVFYKNLESDLKNIEFYTNIPCVIFIESGKETITCAENKTHELCENTAIFLPQGINLHSDYVKTTENLKAYLVFFTQELLIDFIDTKNQVVRQNTVITEFLKIKCGNLIEGYFHSVQQLHKQGCNSPALIRIKLLELLHLLNFYDNRIFQAVIQSNKNARSPKRNLKRLLNNNDTLKLTIKDLANLSGRSISGFNRDFRAIYATPPKQWLQNKKLDQANQLLMNTDLSVTHIAADLGFDNVSHFIKIFKQKYKTTPKQFKQNN